MLCKENTLYKIRVLLQLTDNMHFTPLGQSVSFQIPFCLILLVKTGNIIKDVPRSTLRPNAMLPRHWSLYFKQHECSAIGMSQWDTSGEVQGPNQFELVVYSHSGLSDLNLFYKVITMASLKQWKWLTIAVELVWLTRLKLVYPKHEKSTSL